jgi:TPR repeat protein
MFQVGQLLFNGSVDGIDELGAAEWYAQAADAGHPEAAYRLGLMLRDARSPNYKLSAYWLDRAIELGHTDAQRARAELIIR